MAKTRAKKVAALRMEFDPMVEWRAMRWRQRDKTTEAMDG